MAALAAVATLIAFAALAADVPAVPTVERPALSAYSAEGADTCLGCHAKPDVVGLFRTKHGDPNDPRGPFGHGGMQCEACHGAGGAHARAGGGPLAGMVDFGPKAHASPARQNGQCLGCHENSAAHDWAGSVHAAAGLACTSCHQLHVLKDPMHEPAAQIAVCSGCHQAAGADLFKPSHHPLREGKMACTACHAPHGSAAPAGLNHNTVTETCTACHAEYRGPFLWEHQPVAEDCSNCHLAHGSAQPSLLTLRTPLLCQTCHQGPGHPSIVNSPAGLPGGTPSALLLGGGCVNCHSQVHGSNSPGGRALMR